MSDAEGAVPAPFPFLTLSVWEQGSALPRRQAAMMTPLLIAIAGTLSLGQAQPAADWKVHVSLPNRAATGLPIVRSL
jgi:hypothetical protein